MVLEQKYLTCGRMECFFTLLLDKIPFSDKTKYGNYGDVVKAITGGEHPALPENTPEKLKDIILSCWAKEPEKRPLFSDLTSMQTDHGSLWEHIEKEAAARGNKEVLELWKEAAGTAPSVQWDKFQAMFWPKMDMTMSQAQENHRSKCIHNLLEVTATGDVTHKAFTNFTTLFSPILTGKQGLNFIDGIVALCKKTYFYGFQGRTPAEAVINEVLKSNPNPYLLRISTTVGIQFCLSYVPVKQKGAKETKLEIVHLPILPPTYMETGIAAYVEKFTATNLKVKETKGIRRTLNDLFTDTALLTLQQTATVESSYGGQPSGSMVKTIND